MSSSDIIKALDEAGIPCETFVYEKTEEDRQRERDLEAFLKAEDEAQERSKNIHMVFK